MYICILFGFYQWKGGLEKNDVLFAHAPEPNFGFTVEEGRHTVRSFTPSQREKIHGKK
jgi:hypothetical protein